MDVMSAVAEANFEKKIAEHLRMHYPDSIVRPPDGEESSVRELPANALEHLVRVAIAKARRYEVTRQSSIAAFAAMMFDVAPNFDRYRLCEVLLGDEEKSPDERVDEIANVLTEKNWDSIRRDYDPQAWILPEEPDPLVDAKTDEVPSAGDGPVNAKKPDPLARTVKGKTLSRIAGKKHEKVEIQPQASEAEIDSDTVKIDRHES